MKYPNHIILDIKTVANNKVTQSETHYSATQGVKSAAQLPYSSVSTNVETKGRETVKTTSNVNSNIALLNTLFDINFLRKERMYTKLKFAEMHRQIQ